MDERQKVLIVFSFIQEVVSLVQDESISKKLYAKKRILIPFPSSFPYDW